MGATAATRRVLWVTYDFPPRQAAGAFRPVNLYRHLDRSRFEIEFLTSQSEPFADGVRLLDGIEPPPIVHRAAGVPLDRLFDGLRGRLERLGLADDDRARRTLLERLAYRAVLPLAFPDKHALWGACAALAAWRLARRRHYDAIYTTSHPESAHLAGLLLASRGMRWIVDYRYGGPMWTTALSGRRASLWSARLLLGFQRRVLQRADHVIVQSETLRRAFIDRFEVEPGRIRTLPNGYDERLFLAPATAAPFERRAGELHVLHVGADWYPDPPHVANLCDLLNRLRDEPGVSDVVLHAVGVDVLGGDAAAHGARFRYVFHGTRPHREILAYLDAADAFVLSTMARKDDGDSIVGFLPTKLWEYLRAGKPILWMGPRDDAWRFAEDCGAVIYLGPLGAPISPDAAAVRTAIAAGPAHRERALEHSWEQRAQEFNGILAAALQ